MPVTEVAILPLAPGTCASSPELLAVLHNCKAVQEKHSGFAVNFFQQIEDPSLFYLIGAWQSPSAHEAFIATSENESALDELQHLIQVNGIIMYHLKLDIESTPLPLDAPAISINRHFIKAGQRAAFEKQFEQSKPLLQAYTKPRSVAGGWRIEREEEGKEEWVLFSGFDSTEHHHGFAKTAEFEEYRGLVEFVDGFEVKHLKRITGV